MDREESRKREKEISEDESEAEFALMLQIIEDGHQKTREAIDEKLKSRWIWGNDRTFLHMIKTLEHMNAENAKQIIKTVQQIYIIQKRLDNIENIIRKLPLIEKKIAKFQKKIPKEVKQYINESRKFMEDFKEYFANRWFAE